jgi:Flp pilus assembly pilin Flp
MPPGTSSPKLEAQDPGRLGRFPRQPQERENMFGSTLLRRMTQWRAAMRSEDGQAMVEYALLISLISIVCFSVVQVFGLEVSSLYVKITNVVH